MSDKNSPANDRTSIRKTSMLPATAAAKPAAEEGKQAQPREVTSINALGIKNEPDQAASKEVGEVNVEESNSPLDSFPAAGLLLPLLFLLGLLLFLCR